MEVIDFFVQSYQRMSVEVWRELCEDRGNFKRQEDADMLE